MKPVWIAALAGLVLGLASWASAIDSSPSVLTLRQSKLFSQACADCHLREGVSVPVLGEDADWEKRRARGFESLLASTINGVGNMPPLGTCSACTEDDFRALISFLARLPDPKAGAEGAER